MSGGRGGLAAPDGYRWCRGRSGTWHFLRAAELVHQGEARATARSVCGLWASRPGGRDGWEEVTERAPPEPHRMCRSCLTGVAEVRRVLRLAAQEPPAAQGRLLWPVGREERPREPTAPRERGRPDG